MDRVEQYRQWIREIFEEYGCIQPSNGEIVVFPNLNFDQDHYQVCHMGWNRDQRIFGVLLHADIVEGKIWIQHDGTEEGLANLLVERGVPKTDIVLAFHPPELRPYNGFAVA